ncbi:MAG: leucine-rich repeat domain-containing protein [Paludibacteraceae bacterium]|nr:leucine-rich repeat domain-containing protein [Paludibacteraceae bacterium]
MKKLTTLLLALVAGAGTMFASNTSVDGIWYNFDDGNLTAEVTYRGDYSSAWEEYSGEVVIPSSVTYNDKTYIVTSIGDDAFYRCHGLTSVTIPNSVTSIGDVAFSYCSGLTSLSVEAGNTVYDSRNNCNAIIKTSTNTLIFGCQNTTIPNTVTSIGEYAFYNCIYLTSVTIPNSVTSIGNLAFRGCTGLTSLSVKAGNTVYDSRNNCNAIIKTSTNTLIWGCQNTTIPNSVTSIGDDAFAYCSGLTSVTIPNSVTSIGLNAFNRCSGLTAVTIPNSVTTIGSYAFYGCSGLTSVTIPNSVTSIGLSAFEGCSGLTSVTIPNSVTTIGSYAFSGCSGLTSVTIPNSVTSIGSSAFFNCTGLTSVTIPNSVTSIGGGAFRNCTGLTSVTIPNSVTSIGLNAFNRCSGLTAVTNYATTPQSINSNVFEYVNKSTCVLNVPKESVSLYQAAEVWKEFTNIMGVDVPEEPIETIEGDYTIYYVDKESQDLYNHVVTLYVPVAPAIEGFTFIGWQTVSSMLSEGITIQAVYQSNIPTNAPAVYTNPANPAQKLIKNGNVYILTDDKTYTITGQQVK